MPEISITDEKEWGRIGPKGPPSMIRDLCPAGPMLWIAEAVWVGGRLVFHIFGALAEFEHSLIRKRTVTGLEAAGSDVSLPCRSPTSESRWLCW
jgi:hypothetical protein